MAVSKVCRAALQSLVVSSKVKLLFAKQSLSTRACPFDDYPPQQEYFRRVRKAIDSNDLVLEKVMLKDLQQGISLAPAEVEEVHSGAMQHAEDSVQLGGKPITSPEGGLALDMLMKLEEILGVPCDDRSLISRLKSETNVDPSSPF